LPRRSPLLALRTAVYTSIPRRQSRQRRHRASKLHARPQRNRPRWSLGRALSGVARGGHVRCRRGMGRRGRRCRPGHCLPGTHGPGTRAGREPGGFASCERQTPLYHSRRKTQGSAHFHDCCCGHSARSAGRAVSALRTRSQPWRFRRPSRALVEQHPLVSFRSHAGANQSAPRRTHWRWMGHRVSSLSAVMLPPTALVLS
jgi:hypothetical protein